MHLFFTCNFTRAIWFLFGLKSDEFNHNLYPSDVIQRILSSHHADLDLDTSFTLLWNIWKARNDLLFNKKKWSIMQVIYATNAMLNAELMEEKAAAHINPANNNISPFHVQNIQFQNAGLLAYSDAAYNPEIAKEEAGLGVFLRNVSNNHTVFVQAAAKNVCSVLQAEAIGLSLSAEVVKALGWNTAIFLSDCRNLVQVAKARNLLARPEDWRIRPMLAEFLNHTSFLSSCEVRSIPRNGNVIAHSLAKKAFMQRAVSSSSILCSKSSGCKAQQALNSISFPFGKLISVHCLGCK